MYEYIVLSWTSVIKIVYVYDVLKSRFIGLLKNYILTGLNTISLTCFFQESQNLKKVFFSIRYIKPI